MIKLADFEIGQTYLLKRKGAYFRAEFQRVGAGHYQFEGEFVKMKDNNLKIMSFIEARLMGWESKGKVEDRTYGA